MESRPRPRMLLDQVCNVLRLKHCSYCAEQACVGWLTGRTTTAFQTSSDSS
jgi:hypothetical protein